jgi:hypothetical protein
VLVVRAVIRKIHTSHLGTHEFNQMRANEKISRGLEAIGKTRFGTVIRAARAVLDCIPAIRRMVDEGKFSLGVRSTSVFLLSLDLYSHSQEHDKYFRSQKWEASRFSLSLRHLVDLGLPALNALTCLESNDCTAGDVCVYWHAMLTIMDSHIHNLLAGGEIDAETAGRLYAILHQRNNELFGDGRISTANDLFYAGLYLDPSSFAFVIIHLLTAHNYSQSISNATQTYFVLILEILTQLPLPMKTIKESSIRLSTGVLQISCTKSPLKRFSMGTKKSSRGGMGMQPNLTCASRRR